MNEIAEVNANESQQVETPLAIIRGEPMLTMPQDLYIPPQALEVFLEAFEGPLDLLLYLIKKQNFDILDIPIADVTRQYMSYIGLMKEMRLELAAEYLVMAAMLAEIKSRCLLPKPPSLNADEEDPRAELIRRLQEYERMKQAALELDSLPQLGEDFFWASAQIEEIEATRPLPDVKMEEILLAMRDILKRAALVTHHQIARESLSIRERMSTILSRLNDRQSIAFGDLFTIEEGRMGVVVTFIAILELLKQTLIEIIQEAPLAAIEVRSIQKQSDEASIEISDFGVTELQ